MLLTIGVIGGGQRCTQNIQLFPVLCLHEDACDLWLQLQMTNPLSFQGYVWHPSLCSSELLVLYVQLGCAQIPGFFSAKCTQFFPITTY